MLFDAWRSQMEALSASKETSIYRRLATIHDRHRQTDGRTDVNTAAIPTHWLVSHVSAKTYVRSVTLSPKMGRGGVNEFIIFLLFLCSVLLI